MSMQHFSISGVFENKLVDDLEEAQGDINDAKGSVQNGWKLIFSPKDYELDDSVVDVEAFRLSAKVLEVLGV